jgi:hypothetical protein
MNNPHSQRFKAPAGLPLARDLVAPRCAALVGLEFFGIFNRQL